MGDLKSGAGVGVEALRDRAAVWLFTVPSLLYTLTLCQKVSYAIDSVQNLFCAICTVSKSVLGTLYGLQRCPMDLLSVLC